MSYWLDNIASDAIEPEQWPEDVFDVVIVGCGISGASTAYHLALNEPSGKYLVVERGAISSGATGCNGGFICPGTSEKFSASVERYGLDATQEIYDYTVKCTKAVKDFVRDSESACEMRFHGCVHLARTVEELAALKLSYEQLLSFNQQVLWWDEEMCYNRTKSNSYLGGMYKPNAGNLWAAKLVHSLVTEAKQRGVQIITHCPVLSVTEMKEGILEVHTSRGLVQTRKVVYCTNAWSRELLPELAELIIPVRNQLIMTEPVERLWDFSLSCNFGYEYFMQRPDGRVLLGGMRNLTPHMEVNSADPTSLDATVSAALRAYLPAHFPGIRPLTATSTDSTTEAETETLDAPHAAPGSGGASIRVESEWIGIMGFTPDRNPLVGPLAAHPGQYILAGYTGHGMPVAFLAGRNIADLICGVKSTVPTPRAYAPARYSL